MESADARTNLDRLIREHGDNYVAISRLLGRNPAYIQQFVKRGTPRKLDENDRRVLSRYFGVDERLLGGSAFAPHRPPVAQRVREPALAPEFWVVPRLALGASAGAGMLDQSEAAAGALAFDARWLRALGGRPELLSIIRVEGDSMTPTLGDGDEIMVDRDDAGGRLRDGIYVLRLDDLLVVKRVVLKPSPGRVAVRSDNPHFPSREDVGVDELVIVGRVIWTGRRIG